MKIKKLNVSLISLLVLIISSIYFLMQFSTQRHLENNYEKISNKMKNNLEILIKEKQNTTRIIALSISNNELLKSALLNTKTSLFDLNAYSKQLRENSDFKNVWFQVLSKDGISLQRSWTNKKGDDLSLIRYDIKKMIKEQKIISSISTGKFDMTFKAMVPIMNDGLFIGIIEVITHFNSISKKLLENDIDSVFLVDKSYKKQLIKPFTKLFVKDYYVANYNAKKEHLKYFSEINLDLFLKKEQSYIIDKKSDKFMLIYRLPNHLGKEMGHLIMIKRLSSMDNNGINALRQVYLFAMVLVVLLFILFVFYYKNKINSKLVIKQNNELEKLNIENSERIKQLEIQKNKTDKIFNAQPSITIITNGQKLYDVNHSFFKVFNEYKNIDEFLKEHRCISDFIGSFDGKNYINSNVVAGTNWIEYILKYSDIQHKVKINYKNNSYHFIVSANKSDHIEENGEDLVVVSFIDITDEYNLNNSLMQKEKIMMQQSKLASMGEMIGNIAHQWRQPLSQISISASAVSLKKQYGMLTDEYLDDSVKSILSSVDHLSETIDDFRNYFKPDKKAEEFDIQSTIDKTLSLTSSKFKNLGIKIINESKSYNIYGFENEIIQVFMNILNNAKDALDEVDTKKFIFINTCINNENLYVTIKDNAGGISSNIIDRVFEPYFTTKHQSQGTGIGLYMVEEMIKKHMNGNVEVKNKTYRYDGNDYVGAEFTVSLPLK